MTTSGRVPDLLVEKVHLGEASEAERALVLGDPDARARLEALPAQDAAFLADFPVDEAVRRIEGRARTAAARRDNRPAVLSAVLAPLMAAAVALMWVVAVPHPPTATDGVRADDVRTKGLPPRLRVYRQRGTTADRLATGAVARQGDVVQVGVVAGSATHGVVVSLDGRGEVTVHQPPGGHGSTALGSGELQLPQGYELDDAPAYERFFLVTTDGAGDVDVGRVVGAAKALAGRDDARTAPLELPSGYRQTAFLLRKEQR